MAIIVPFSGGSTLNTISSSSLLSGFFDFIPEKNVGNTLLVMDRVRTRKTGFRKCRHRGEMGLRQVEQGFSSFFAKKIKKLAYFNDFSRWSVLRAQ